MSGLRSLILSIHPNWFGLAGKTHGIESSRARSSTDTMSTEQPG